MGRFSGGDPGGNQKQGKRRFHIFFVLLINKPGRVKTLFSGSPKASRGVNNA
jgi:hypothetical protein